MNKLTYQTTLDLVDLIGICEADKLYESIDDFDSFWNASYDINNIIRYETAK